jgi:hypothetical protein
VVRVRVDFAQYPETYYFHENDEGQALPSWAPFAYRLAQRLRTAGPADAQLAAAVLERALADLAATLDSHFLHTGDPPEAVFECYRAEHERG